MIARQHDVAAGQTFQELCGVSGVRVDTLEIQSEVRISTGVHFLMPV